MMENRPKRIRLLGPPGTGKTTFLIRLIRTAVRSGRYDLKKIGFLSFSRAAADEARKRVLSALPEYGWDDLNYFGTIHSVSKQMLGVKQDQILAGKLIREFSMNTEWRLTDDDGGSEDIFWTPALFSIGDICRSIKSMHLHTGLPLSAVLEGYNSGNRLVVEECEYNEFIKAYEDFKTRDRGMKRLYDFDDLLLEAKDSLVLPKLDLLIVDEAQDLSKLLWDVAEKWGKNARQVIIAGDPYQAIYEFQGASPELMLCWEHDFSVVLDKSWRCPFQVYQASRKIVSRFETRYSGDGFIPSRDGGIVAEMDYKPGFENKSTFFLCRDNRTVNHYVARWRDEGIPFGFTGSRRKSVIALKGSQNIFNLEKLYRKMGISPADLADLLDVIPMNPFLQRGAKKTAKEKRSRLNDREWMEKTIDFTKLDESGFTELGINALSSGELFNNLGGTCPENVRYIRKIVDRFGFEHQSSEPHLRIGTIHSVKGKEADVVVIDPFLPKRAQLNLEEFPDSEHRLAYVALTRSKDWVWIMPGTETAYDYPRGHQGDFSEAGSGICREKLIESILGGSEGIIEEDEDLYEPYGRFELCDMPF